jgi:flagellar assembly protein FliH
LIKAYSVSYDEPTKKLDLNEKAENFRRLYVERLEKQSSGETQDGEYADDDDGFVEGIVGDRVIIKGSEEETLSEQEKKILANQREIEKLQKKLEDLRVEAGKILDDAEEQAEEIINNAKAEAETQYESLIQSYMEQGYEEGRQTATKECDELKASLERQIRENEENYEKQVSELEPAFVEIVISLVEKLTGIYASEKEGIISYLVESAFEDIPRSNEYIVRVPESFHDGVEGLKARLEEAVGEEARVEIVEDKLLPVDGAMIETDSRIFDCSLSTMKDTLFENLRLLALSHSRSDGEGQ